MKIIQINKTCGVGSTGKICVSISKKLNEIGLENYVLYSSGTSNYQHSIKFCTPVEQKITALSKRLLGNDGFNAWTSTKRLLKIIDKIHPDIVHIHNIHSNDVNIELLFEYLKHNNIKVVYTFHDCWAFTGYCPHFSMLSCNKWKTKCTSCEYRKEVSWLWDKSSEIWHRKRKALSGLNMTIVTPSVWLSDLVKQSFLKQYPVKVINNGIDLSIFKKTQSSFREKYNLQAKFVILGVAFDWGKRKGLDVFVELSNRLNKNDFAIVLVGINKETKKNLPNEIITIERTNNQSQLAELYSAADLFVNATREDTYPTVNMEAIACGTPVVTFKTGGSPEIILDGTGTVVDCDDFDALLDEILRRSKSYKEETNCLNSAHFFDENIKFNQYIELYSEISMSHFNTKKGGSLCRNN